jgi:hypothetical protein
VDACGVERIGVFWIIGLLAMNASGHHRRGGGERDVGKRREVKDGELRR